MWTNSGTHTWVVPQGVTKVFAFVIGAGGGGYAYNEYHTSKFYHGGCGGGYAHGVCPVTPGGSITITVGRGGTGYNRIIATSGNAGGNSSFGSFLTGNGGNGGSYTTSDNGNQDGNGGSASTSGVTEAYTAAGGKVRDAYRGSYIYGAGSSFPSGMFYGLSGGASSGSPFGIGRSPRRTGGTGICGGGAGWAYEQDFGGSFSLNSSEFRQQRNAFPGEGSHRYPQSLGSWSDRMYSNTSRYMTPSRGGHGLISKGGQSYAEAGFSVSNDSNYTYGRSINLNIMHGEDQPWWFPWEVDGGGGGAGIPMEQDNWHDGFFEGGRGGSGAGGGGVLSGMYAQSLVVTGGQGGFGGGGGSAGYGRDHYNNEPGVTKGGNGGIGGGGGAAWTHKDWGNNAYSNDRNHTAFGGHGGNGCVCVYW